MSRDALEYFYGITPERLDAMRNTPPPKSTDEAWKERHLLQEQHIAELENRLRALWDKYDGDRKHYMDRIKRLEEAGDALYENSDPTRWDSLQAANRKLDDQEAWRKAKEDKP